jgi:hypothetical protein
MSEERLEFIVAGHNCGKITSIYWLGDAKILSFAADA